MVAAADWEEGGKHVKGKLLSYLSNCGAECEESYILHRSRLRTHLTQDRLKRDVYLSTLLLAVTP